MSLVKTPIEKAAGALDAAHRRLAGFQVERADKAAKALAETDFEAGFALREEVATLDRKIEAATTARGHAVAQLERAEHEAAEAEKDRQHAAAQKVAAAHAKLTLDIVGASERLAGMLAEAERMRKEIDAANAARESRPPIVDGEQKVREIPARVIPASIREEMAWLNAKGERPSQLRANKDGVLVPMDHRGPWEYKKVQVEQSAERHEPARMVERLASSIKLVRLHGETLWPAR